MAQADAGASAPATEVAEPSEKQGEGVKKKDKVVVLGTGWGGTSFIKGLDTSLYDVYVISPRNYFAFTPLLPSVTTGTVEARSITEPIRRLVKSVRSTVVWPHPTRCFARTGELRAYL